jgi:type IV pilus assembly protein PilE
MKRKMRKQSGMTLIEVLVTVAIVGILAAIAIPSYDSYTRKTRRAGAKTTVEHVRGLMEQYYINNKSYTADLSKLGFTNSTPHIDKTGEEITSAGFPGAVYLITVTVPGVTYCSNCNYEIVATPQNTQADDTDCAIMWFNALGQKGAVDSGGASTTSCW